MAANKPGRLKASIRRAKGRAVQANGWAASAIQALARTSKYLMEEGALPKCRGSQEVDEICMPCHRSFSTKQAWAVHAFNQHGRLAACRGRVEGETCPHCLKKYASNQKLVRHFQQTACGDKVAKAGYVAKVQPGRRSTADSKNTRQLVPPLQAMGPAKPVIAREIQDTLEYHEDIYGDLLDSLAGPQEQLGTASSVLDHYVSILSKYCCDRSTLHATLALWQTSMKDLGESQWEDNREEVHGLATARLLGFSTAELLGSAGAQPGYSTWRSRACRPSGP